MYIELFQNLGLSKNESEIYEALLYLGEAGVSQISTKTNINRRNIYDVLNRMMEKGLVFQILEKNDNKYKPVEPGKLKEILKEKESMLNASFPGLEDLYHSHPKENEVYIYKGPEGWKNYMRDMIQVGKPAYFIGAKGGWLDERVKNFFPQFIVEAKKNNIEFYHLFDYEILSEEHDILNYVSDNYKFLPREYSTPGAIDIFGDRVHILSNISTSGFEEDFSFTVIVNQQIADSFRVWFKFMWDMCPHNIANKVSNSLNVS